MHKQQHAIEPSPIRHVAGAWFVHALTASGGAIGLLALAAIGEDRYISAFAWMSVAIAIDSVDGTLARVFRVKHFLPTIDGALLDNIVDYFTYVIVPAYFIYQSGLIPGPMGVVAALAIVLASAYQFCQADAKTEDHYFKGFPSYWNVVVFYLFFLDLSPRVNLAIVMVLAFAVFVPIKYVYPSRTRAFRSLTLVLSTGWGIMVLAVLLRYPRVNLPLVYVSLVYVAYYFAIGFYITWRDRRHAQRVSEMKGA